MTKPVTIPNTFATATTAIPLSQLDSDFSTVATALNDANTYSNYAADTGVANAYVVTLTGVSTTYSAGLRIQFKAGASNTGASTLNVNGGGTKNITFQDASALSSGTIAANAIVDVMYDGTQFLLMNDPAGATGGDVVGPASATDNAIVRFDGATGKLVQNSVVTIADSTGDISGVGTLNATTLDATNIEVTNIKAKDGTAAASIADSTGVISVTANPVLSGGTANGVLYLNGSKVLTTGSEFSYNGAVFQVGSGAATRIIDAVGASNSVSYRLRNWDAIGCDAGSGLTIGGLTGSQWTNTQFFASGSEAMRLTSTGLGIGTSSPSYRVHAVGASGTEEIARFASSGTDIDAQLTVAPTGGGYGRFNSSANMLTLAVAGSSKVYVNTSGNLGLGVTPSAWDANGKGLQVGNQLALSWTTATGSFVGGNAYYGLGWKRIGTGAATAYLLGGDGAHIWYSTSTSGSANSAISFTQALTLDASGNLLLGGTSAGASSAASLAIFNGTAPTGSVTNGIILYAEDVSSSSELKVRDEAGNVTTLSPHNFSLIPDGPSEDMAWAYYSEKGGKRINVDMLKLARMVEKLTGEKLVYES